MSNIIKAFINIVNNHQVNIETLTRGNNRANNMGEGLEAYIKDMFAGTSHEANVQKKLEIFEELYSYQGNKNNPPDLIFLGNNSPSPMGRNLMLLK